MADRRSTTSERSGLKGTSNRKPETVRVKMLGGFKVSVGSRTVGQDAWRLRKAIALVKLLALAPRHRLHREQAMDLLWPDAGKTAASNNLRRVLHAGRKALDPTAGSHYLALEDVSLTLCPKSDLWVDVDAFEEAAATARRGREPAAYRAAIDLYTGDLLPEDRYEEWAESRRQKVRRLYIALHVELAGLYEERGEYESGIEVLLQVVEEKFALEESYAGLMRLYARLGRRREALAQYERLRAVLSRELGAEPDAITRRLRDDIATDRFPPVQSAGPPQGELSGASKHNLPAPRTSFVGREREMLEVKRELVMTRLLTLTGTGGSGKTRLALELAGDLVGTYPDGVWLVDFASLAQAELIPQAVADVLKVPQRPDRPLTETITEALRAKEMLLVLDNCEHLVEPAADLADVLLAACPRLRVLATSREPLGVPGEVLWRVSPLSVPATDEPLTVGELRRYDAARLFLQRARLRLPGFDPVPHEATAVAAVCTRLEGIPLAVELAAARVGTLSLEQLAERLRDSLGLLSGGPRSVPYRQRTMRATLDWSHALLSEGEQRLFRQLSVFVGGWTLEAAEAVGSGGGVEQQDVLDLLSGLLDKSLITADTTGSAALRYGMLQPVRQYALERLGESREAEGVRRRHAEYFSTLAEEAKPWWFGPEEGAWLDRLQAELDNVRAALSWALGGGDAGLGLKLASALARFWMVRGYFNEGRGWLEKAVAKGAAESEPAVRAWALWGLGGIWTYLDDITKAEECLELALDTYEELGDQVQVARVLGSLADCMAMRGDDARATTLYQRAVAIARESGDLAFVADCLGGLGWIAAGAGDLEQGRRLWEEAVSFSRKCGNVRGVAIHLLSMAFVDVTLGNLVEATALLEEGLNLAREVGDKELTAGCLYSMGLAATFGGHPGRGKTLLEKSLRIDTELGLVGGIIAENLEGLAITVGALGQHVRAARLWGAAQALREAADVHWEPIERKLYEPQRAAARSQTDEAVWEATFAEGRTMTTEDAIEYALSEEETVPPATHVSGEPPAGELPGELTRREEEIAALVARGFTNRQIASELSISEHTAATHVRRILKKLGLHSRAQLATWVTERRMSPLDAD